MDGEIEKKKNTHVIRTVGGPLTAVDGRLGM